MNTLSGTKLYGDWRRRAGTKTDAHLYERSRPMCGKRIALDATVKVARGEPCLECLVMALTRPSAVPA